MHTLSIAVVMYEAIAIPVIVVSIFKITEAGFACNFMSAVVLLHLSNWNIGLEVTIFAWDCLLFQFMVTFCFLLLYL